MEKDFAAHVQSPATSLVAAPNLAWPASDMVPKSLDHVILGCSDLDATASSTFFNGLESAPPREECIRAREREMRLLSLYGELRYLEIIAPDPLQPASTDSRHVADLGTPALVGWAIHRNDVDGFASIVQTAGHRVTWVHKPGSRARPDGTTLVKA